MNLQVGRPPKYTDKTRLRLHTTGQSNLQKRSLRRAIVNLMVKNKGVMSLKEIDEHFGFDTRTQAIALLRAGWVQVVEDEL